jgi:hypothetical protein
MLSSYLIIIFITVPGSPADIKVVVNSLQSLKLSWLPPLEPNGIITKYNLYKRSMNGRQEVDHAKQTISSQHTSYEIKTIQAHIEYQFWVTASTRIGEGQSSRVVSQVASSRGRYIIRYYMYRLYSGGLELKGPMSVFCCFELIMHSICFLALFHMLKSQCQIQTIADL